MIVIIQCAGRKQPDAGTLITRDGKRVLFVGDPAKAPPVRGTVYAQPDDISDTGKTWRENLLKYNASRGSNPLGLLPAYELYQNPTYSKLVEHYGLGKTFILSAGWGLIPASFLTPDYDITFSASAKAYKKRKHADSYSDFSMLPEDATDDLYFFGGKDYVPLFAKLTSGYRGKRIVFYNSASLPDAKGCLLRRFVTRTMTNWHYECAQAFMAAARVQDVGNVKAGGSQKQIEKPDRNRDRQRPKTGDKHVKPSIETVWARLKQLQGQPFETKTGMPFTFEISGNIFRSSRAKYNLTKSDFSKVLRLSPIDGPGEINNLVRGPAYIWAVIHDPRVRKGEW